MTGRRRALLIGAQTGGLTGVHRDLDVIERLLTQRRFDDIIPCSGDDATYAGITGAIRNLITTTRPDDDVVLFYSGHGSRSLRRDAQQRRQRGESVYLQYVVPVDLTESTEDQFNGLLAQELSMFQRALTDITPGVTTILDCCYAGGMARDNALVPRFLSRTVPTSAAFVRLDTIGEDFPVGNELAVRLVASEMDRPAYEGPTNAPGGLFTRALVHVLTELNDRRVPWRNILRQVRELLEVTDGRQRPTVEGPGRRYPFSREESRVDDGLPVRHDNDVVRVVAGALFGLTVGDVVRLSLADHETILLESEVSHADGADAVLSAPAAAVQQLPADLVALPIRTQARQPVFIDTAAPAPRELRDAITQSPRLQLTDHRAGTFTVRAADGGLMIEDAGGAPARLTTLSADPDRAGQVVDLLELLAKGERVRRLSDGTGEARLDGTVDVSVRLATDGGDESDGGAPALIHNGDRLLISARNRRSAKVYVWLFDVGVSGRVTLLSNDQPDGRPLEPADQFGDTHTFGGSTGVAFFWPPDVPADGPRPETLIVVAADRQLDLHPLESRDDNPETQRGDLQGLLAEAVNGTREGHPVAKDVPRYLLLRVDLLLAPDPRPRSDEPGFEVDDRPDSSVREIRPRAAPDAPRRVAVRLLDLVVRRNRALFNADVRVDWITVTDDGTGTPQAQPHTQRFPRIADRDQLPVDRMLLYHGGVHDYLELALWVSRDDQRGADLATLFGQRVNDPAVQAQLAVVAGLVVAAPQAAAAVGVVAAVATIIRVAGDLVRTATGRDIGLYRTSWLAFERFGVGRMPSHGLRPAQDVEFALEVIDLDQPGDAIGLTLAGF